MGHCAFGGFRFAVQGSMDSAGYIPPGASKCVLTIYQRTAALPVPQRFVAPFVPQVRKTLFAVGEGLRGEAPAVGPSAGVAQRG